MKTVLLVDDDNSVLLGTGVRLEKPFAATSLADAIELALAPNDKWLARANGL